METTFSAIRQKKSDEESSQGISHILYWDANFRENETLASQYVFLPA